MLLVSSIASFVLTWGGIGFVNVHADLPEKVKASYKASDLAFENGHFELASDLGYVQLKDGGFEEFAETNNQNNSFKAKFQRKFTSVKNFFRRKARREEQNGFQKYILSIYGENFETRYSELLQAKDSFIETKKQLMKEAQQHSLFNRFLQRIQGNDQTRELKKIDNMFPPKYTLISTNVDFEKRLQSLSLFLNNLVGDDRQLFFSIFMKMKLDHERLETLRASKNIGMTSKQKNNQNACQKIKKSKIHFSKPSQVLDLLKNKYQAPELFNRPIVDKVEILVKKNPQLFTREFVNVWA